MCRTMMASTQEQHSCAMIAVPTPNREPVRMEDHIPQIAGVHLVPTAPIVVHEKVMVSFALPERGTRAVDHCGEGATPCQVATVATKAPLLPVADAIGVPRDDSTREGIKALRLSLNHASHAPRESTAT